MNPSQQPSSALQAVLLASLYGLDWRCSGLRALTAAQSAQTDMQQRGVQRHWMRAVPSSAGSARRLLPSISPGSTPSPSFSAVPEALFPAIHAVARCWRETRQLRKTQRMTTTAAPAAATVENEPAADAPVDADASVPQAEGTSAVLSSLGDDETPRCVAPVATVIAATTAAPHDAATAAHGLGLVLLRSVALSLAARVVRVPTHLTAGAERASSPLKLPSGSSNTSSTVAVAGSLLPPRAAHCQPDKDATRGNPAGRPSSSPLNAPPRSASPSGAGASSKNPGRNGQQPPARRTLLLRSATSSKLSMIVSTLRDDDRPFDQRAATAATENESFVDAFESSAEYTSAVWAPAAAGTAAASKPPLVASAVASRGSSDRSSVSVSAAVLASAPSQPIRRVFRHNIPLRDTLLALARHRQPRGSGRSHPKEHSVPAQGTLPLRLVVE